MGFFAYRLAPLRGVQAYADNLIATGQCYAAVVAGHDGTIWAQAGITATNAEMAGIGSVPLPSHHPDAARTLHTACTRLG